MATFFSLQGAWRHGALHLAPVEPLDPASALATARGQNVGHALALAWDGGTKRMDWVDTSFPPIVVVSDNLVQTLRAASLSGWTTYPVEITGKDGQPVTGYHGLAITGRCGPIDNERSVEVEKPAISEHGQPFRVFTGLYFEEETWDGCDLFMPEGTAWICATDRVKAALERIPISNVAFSRLSEVERSPASLR